VGVRELRTSQGHKAYVHSIPVQNVGGSGNSPLGVLAHKKTRPVLQAPDGPCLGGQRARARPTQVLKLCMCPLWVLNSPEPLLFCAGGLICDRYLRNSPAVGSNNI